jgi:hypothetical protein
VTILRASRSLGSIAPKVGNLIRRLNSSFDGEIVATVFALRRVLEGVDWDLNDLADMLESSGACPESRHRSGAHDSAPIWRSLSSEQRANWLESILVHCELSDWENRFVSDLRVRASLFPAWTPSAKQIAKADAILLQAWLAGVRP